MILWNKTRKKFLIAFSAVWIILTIGTSIYIYPEKRNNPKLGKEEWINLLRKENKTHEENIAVLKILKEENAFDLDKMEFKNLIEESIASLGSSIVHHQIKFNERKQKSIELLFYGLGTLVGTWGLLYFFSEKAR